MSLLLLYDNFELRSVRHYAPTGVFHLLIASLVPTLLDYGNVTLAGISVCLTARFRPVLNTAAAARMISRLRRRDHTSQAHADLHWLRSQNARKDRFLPLEEATASRAVLLSYPGRMGGRTGGNAFGAS